MTIEHIDPLTQDDNFILEDIPEPIELRFFQRMRLRLFGRICIGEQMNKGWSSSLPLYAFKCEKHGLQINHPVGHGGYLLCPECTRESALK